MKKLNKRAQSELAGFGIIIIIVAVLILVFVSFSIKKPSEDIIESYETEAFVNSVLQFTTTCERNSRHLSFRELVNHCGEEKLCDSGEDSCEVLNSTAESIVESSWLVGEEFPVKGYEFLIMYEGEELVNLEKGEKTGENRGSRQIFSQNLEISFVSYY